jgi:hypothetical protein
MSFVEIEKEVETLTPEQQRKLMARLAALELRRDVELQKELARRLDDRSPGAWIPFEEAKRRLGLEK